MFVRILSELRYRWRALASRDRMEDELGDELAFHLEQEHRKLAARGVPGDEARRQARLAFGGIEGVREAARDARGVRLFEDTWDDLRAVVRSLRSNRAFTIGVAGTLALGIGVNAAMFGVVDRLMFRTPQGLVDAGRVHRVHLRWIQNRQPRTERNMQFPRYQDFARTLQTVDLVGAFQMRTLAIGEGEDTREGRVAVVSAGYLDFFDATPALGRWFTAEEDRPPAGTPLAVVSHAYWLTQFGGRADVIGQSIQIDRLRATIIGVAPPGFTGVSDAGAPAVFVAMSAFAHALRGPGYDTSYNWGWLELLVRRAPGVSVEAADADLSRAFVSSWRNEDQARGETTDFAVWQPTAALGPVHLGRGPDADVEARVALWTSGVAILVLLIACANVANLFLSRAVSRRREVAMRLALGVGRGRLTRQFVMESAWLGLLGAAGGLLLAAWFGGAPQRLLLPAGDAATVIGDARTWLYAAALALVAGALTAVVPSVMAGRIDVAAALKSGGRGSSTRRSRLQAGLIVVQAALSVVLLIGAALFVRSLQHAQQHRLGFDVDPLVVAEVNARGAQLTADQWRQLGTRIMEGVRQVPALSHVTMTASIPFWSNEARGLSVPGIEQIEDLGRFTLQAGTAEYFETTGTRILRGRGFDRTDVAGTQPVIVVSEPMAEALWPGQDPLGRCVRVGPKDSPCQTVIGVAEESAMTALEPTRSYTYYLPVEQFPDGASPQFFLRVQGDVAAAIPDLRREIQALLPAPAYVNLVPLRSLIDPQFRAWRLGATAFAAFGGLALVLAVLGLHSVMAYESARRAQEFGVRLALGATRGRILRLVVGRGAALAGVGVSIGSLIALGASGPFSALLFRQSARDPIVFSAVAVTLVLAACVACAWPAFQATRLDPSDTLRAE